MSAATPEMLRLQQEFDLECPGPGRWSWTRPTKKSRAGEELKIPERKQFTRALHSLVDPQAWATGLLPKDSEQGRGPVLNISEQSL
eukprot:715568-Hanusia_phi.AAC.1